MNVSRRTRQQKTAAPAIAGAPSGPCQPQDHIAVTFAGATQSIEVATNLRSTQREIMPSESGGGGACGSSSLAFMASCVAGVIKIAIMGSKPANGRFVPEQLCPDGIRRSLFQNMSRFAQTQMMKQYLLSLVTCVSNVTLCFSTR